MKYDKTKMEAEYMQRMTSELQMYLLSKTTEVPDKFKRKDFIKAMIRTYLQTDIDHLTSEQRTSLYNKMPSKMQQFKEDHPSEKNTKVLKSWLSIYVREQVANLVAESVIKVEPGIKVEPIDYSEWKVLDEVHEEATTSDSNSASNNESTCVTPTQEIVEKATCSALPQVSTTTETDAKKAQNQKLQSYRNVERFNEGKQGEVSKNPNWNSFKIPKKTVDPLHNIDKSVTTPVKPTAQPKKVPDPSAPSDNDKTEASNNESTCITSSKTDAKKVQKQKSRTDRTVSLTEGCTEGKVGEVSKQPNWNSFKIPKKSVDPLRNIDKSIATPLKTTAQPKNVSDLSADNDKTSSSKNEPKDTNKKLPKPIKQRRSTTMERVSVQEKEAAKIGFNRLTISGRDEDMVKKAMPIGKRRLTVDCSLQRSVTSGTAAKEPHKKTDIPRETKEPEQVLKVSTKELPQASKIQTHRLTICGHNEDTLKRPMSIGKRRLTVDCSLQRSVTAGTGAKNDALFRAPKEMKEPEKVPKVSTKELNQQLPSKIRHHRLTISGHDENIIKKPMPISKRRLTVDCSLQRSVTAGTSAKNDDISRAPKKTETPKEMKKPEKVPKVSTKELNQQLPSKIRHHRLTISGHDENIIKKPMPISKRRLTVDCNLQHLISSGTKEQNSPSDQQTTSCDVTKFFDEKFSKNNSLTLEGASAAVCNYYFELNPETKFISLSKGSSVEMESRTLFELKELLYWPGVGVKIELPGITIQRYCESNVQWDLVEDENSEISLEHLKPNKDAVFQYYDSKADKVLSSLDPEIELSHDLIRTYLEIMIKCLSVTNYAKRVEFEIILKTLLNDVNKISRSFVNVSYSYFLNDHKYVRVFAQDVELSSNSMLYSLREICNPEIVFKITRCKFQELGKVDTDQMKSYFKAILVEKDPDAIEEFNVMLGKGYTLYCVPCEKNKEIYGQYKCSKRIPYMSQHIGPYCVKEFDCVKCGFHSDVLGLVKDGWHHFCKDDTEEDE